MRLDEEVMNTNPLQCKVLCNIPLFQSRGRLSAEGLRAHVRAVCLLSLACTFMDFFHCFHVIWQNARTYVLFDWIAAYFG